MAKRTPKKLKMRATVVSSASRYCEGAFFVTHDSLLVSGALAVLVSFAPLSALAQGQPTGRVPAQVPPSTLTPAPSGGLAVGPWQWQATQHGDGTTTTVVDPSRYTIAFQPDGTTLIRADCNRVLGSYTVNGTALSIQLGPSTLVGCPPDSQADQFVAGLSQVASFTSVDGSLHLGLGAVGGQMVMTPLSIPDLVGPTWQLQAYNNGRHAVVSLLPQTSITAVFGQDGQVNGSAGCNSYMGPFRSSGDTLSIGPLATTRMACAQPVMQQEAAYVAALEATTEYQFQDGQLWLRDASGATQAVFTTS
jgi:heat shock protein HslJ